MDKHKVARFLGWFSLGLGAAELAAPGTLTRLLGVRKHGTLVRSFGAREVAAGVGLLATKRRHGPWLWARVAGDALDLAALTAGLKRGKKLAVAAAIASVAGVTALDIYTAMQHAKS